MKRDKEQITAAHSAISAATINRIKIKTEEFCKTLGFFWQSGSILGDVSLVWVVFLFLIIQLNKPRLSKKKATYSNGQGVRGSTELKTILG